MAAKSPVRAMAGPEVVRMEAPNSLATTVASVVLPSPWRAREQDMVRRLAAPLGRRDHDAEGLLHLRLAQVIVEPLGTQGEIELQVVLGERRGHRAVAPERRCRALRFRAVPRGLEHHALYVQIECHDFLSTSQTFQGVL